MGGGKGGGGGKGKLGAMGEEGGKRRVLAVSFDFFFFLSHPFSPSSLTLPFSFFYLLSFLVSVLLLLLLSPILFVFTLFSFLCFIISFQRQNKTTYTLPHHFTH